MRLHLKQYTEPIFTRLAKTRSQLVEHPCLIAARGGRLPTTILHAFGLFEKGAQQ